MSDIAKDKAARLLKRRGSLSSLSSHGLIARGKVEKQKETAYKMSSAAQYALHFLNPFHHYLLHGCMSTVSYMDDPGHHDDIPRLALQLENTYQLEPSILFPEATVSNILKDVLMSYLQEEKYEPELCRQMTKTISEVIKARVKELMIPRYKIIVLIHIGQLNEQSMRIGSRCLWNANTDTFSSFSFSNRSLFAVANVYAVYFE